MRPARRSVGRTNVGVGLIDWRNPPVNRESVTQKNFRLSGPELLLGPGGRRGIKAFVAPGVSTQPPVVEDFRRRNNPNLWVPLQCPASRAPEEPRSVDPWTPERTQ